MHHLNEVTCHLWHWCIRYAHYVRVSTHAMSDKASTTSTKSSTHDVSGYDERKEPSRFYAELTSSMIKLTVFVVLFLRTYCTMLKRESAHT